MEAATSTLAIAELTDALRKYGLGEEVKDVVSAIFSLDSRVLKLPR